MSVFISVVSHGHSKLIESLGCLELLCEHFNVIVKSNELSDNLERLMIHPKFSWLNSNFGLGFGANNNLIYRYCVEVLEMKADDIFIVLNPDVFISTEQVFRLVKIIKDRKDKLVSINLFRDRDFTDYDNSVRRFPTLMQFVISFLGFRNTSIIDKRNINIPTGADWAAGSFLAFSASHYGVLCGFDERYFMYCEDIDICYRSYLVGERLIYYPDIKALHLAKHANRKLFSKHFLWHISGVIRFLLVKLGWTDPKSSLNS